jgi:hypothetical protein
VGRPCSGNELGMSTTPDNGEQNSNEDPGMTLHQDLLLIYYSSDILWFSGLLSIFSVTVTSRYYVLSTVT